MRLSSYVFLILFTFLFSISASANSIHGILMVVKGDVEIHQKDKVNKAKIGSKVIPGDTIVTKKDARAKLVMIDKNIINISPESKFVLEKYEYNPEENKKGALLNVIYGKVRTTVNQKYDGEQNKFQVKTKSSVAGVRGTDFLVSFNDVTKSSKVVTFEGKVEVGTALDASGKIMNPVFVTPGQFTVAAIGTPPSAPVNMPQSEVNSLNEQTVAEVQPKDKSENPKDEKKERTPSNTPPPATGPEAELDLLPLPSPPPPPPTTTPMPIATQPLVPVFDPTHAQGKANVIINITPGP